ncbi:hypothetical protein [Kibdelosporangium aridum]|nr:hypothetical protein [Kibdelosporangium aridum]
MIALLAFGLGSAGSAQAAPGRLDTAAQARALGLEPAQVSLLQGTVDQYLARMGGTQTGPNTIDLAGGGQVSIALPGEDYPRRPATAAAGPCDGGTAPGYFCAYRRANGKGDQIVMPGCLGYYIPAFWSTGSWGNNKKKGTRAWFLDKNKKIIFEYPAPSNRQSYSWSATEQVAPC